MTDDLRAVLVELDGALERVAAAIPWAERSGNRVVWDADDLPDGEYPPGVRELFGVCSQISAADVGAGRFVHRLRPRDDHDEYVPHRIEGVGACWPLGSDGGGGWYVVADDGEVLFLPPGYLADNVYRPWNADDVRTVAGTVADFVRTLRDEAVEAAAHCGS